MGRKPDAECRQRILEHVEHLLHLKGYHATSMEELAQYCGMTKANLFHHFGSKEDLALAVLDWKIVEFRARRVEPLCAQGDPVAAVGAMFERAGELYGGNGCKAGCFMGNVAVEMSDLNEKFRVRVADFFKEWAGGMAACLARAQKAGLFGPSLEPRAAAESILSLYEGAILMARASRDATVFARVGEVAKSILTQHKTAPTISAAESVAKEG